MFKKKINVFDCFERKKDNGITYTSVCFKKYMNIVLPACLDQETCALLFFGVFLGGRLAF